MVTEPRGALTYRSLTHAILADSGPFMDYYSLFWDPGAIFMVAEAQGALTLLWSRSDYVPFRGLLHIDLGFRSDFHGY